MSVLLGSISGVKHCNGVDGDVVTFDLSEVTQVTGGECH